MTRTRLANPPLMIIVLLLAVAVGAFAAVRYVQAGQTQGLELLQPNVGAAVNRPGALDAAKLYATRAPGTVAIQAVIGDGTSDGTGFIADAQGHIVTASHVVKSYFAPGQDVASTIYIERESGDRAEAKLIGIDQFNDIAVLKVDPAALGGKLTVLPLGDSDQVAIGSEVAAIGGPFGNDFSISRGIISSTHRTVKSQINLASQIPDAIQFDAAINHGSSGGPLFNARGEVIGMVQQIDTAKGVSQNSGVSFAVPSNLVRHSMANIIKYGSARVPWIGATTATVTPQLARALSLPTTRGAMVQKAVGPAADSGLVSSGRASLYMGDTVTEGDIITKLAGVPVTRTEDVARVVSRLATGAPVSVEYWHAGKLYSSTITPADRVV